MWKPIKTDICLKERFDSDFYFPLSVSATPHIFGCAFSLHLFLSPLTPSLLLGPHIFHEERRGWGREAVGKAGSHYSAQGCLLSLSLTPNFSLCQLFFLPLSSFSLQSPISTCSSPISRLRVSTLLTIWCLLWFLCGLSRERWPCRRRDVSSCCRWALLQLLCSLIVSLSFTLFLTQWLSTAEPLSPPRGLSFMAVLNTFIFDLQIYILFR